MKKNSYPGGTVYYRGTNYMYNPETGVFVSGGGRYFGEAGYYYDYRTGSYMYNGTPVSERGAINGIIAKYGWSVYMSFDDPVSVESVLSYLEAGFTIGTVSLYGKNYIVATEGGLTGWNTIEGKAFSDSDFKFFSEGVAQGQGGNTQPLLANSDVYWTITGTSWLWGGAAALNEPHFRVDAASKAAGKLVGKITVGLNVAATAAEGYDLVTNWDQAGRGDVAKFGVDATLTTVTTILYFTGVGAPVAVILTGVQIANTLGAFDSVYESFNEPMHGGGGSW